MKQDAWFDDFGGIFAAETLLTPLEELEAAWLEARDDPEFKSRLDDLSRPQHFGPFSAV